MDTKGEPIKHYEIDSDTGKVKHDKKGKPIVKRKNPTNLKNSQRIQPMRTLRGKQPKRSDSEETVYSVDSKTGQVKVDKAGKPIPKYELTPRGQKKTDSNGRPMV